MSCPVPCPACGSDWVQPLRVDSASASASPAVVALRCADCLGHWSQVIGRDGLRALDAHQRAARAALVRAHDASVGQSMAALADTLGAALRSGLIGPEDFGPEPRALS